MNLLITLVWNKFSISVGFIIRILPTYALLRETQMPLIFIFKARIKFYSFLLDERYTLAACFICWLANNTLTWNLKKKRKSSLTHSLQAKSLGMLQSCFALKTIATSYRAKRKNAIDLSFIMFLSLSGTQRYLFFWNICPFWLEFWSWEHLSALLMPALPSGAWRQRPQKKLSETEENTTSFSLPCAKTSSHLYLFYIQQNPPLLVQAKKKR